MSALDDDPHAPIATTIAARSSSVQSLGRAFNLLERMADVGGEVSLSELAVSSGMPLPTIHRLMQTLVQLGYVRQNPTRRYALGPGLIRLGDAASRMLGEWVRPYLAELVDLTGESANLAVLDGDEMVYLAHVPSRHSMRMFTEVGRHVLPHGTGVGKAVLAQLPENRVTDIVGRTGMPAYTEHTFTQLEPLLRELSIIRQRGYAIDDGEQELGVRCVAMAVRNAPTPSAISISGPEGRMSLIDDEQLVGHMTRVADQIATALVMIAPD